MKWTIDIARSSADFVVRYVSISTIEGRFTRVCGTIETTEDGWDRILRFGGLLVADEVDLCLNIEAVAAASTPARHSARV